MHDIKLIRDDPAAFDSGLKRRGLQPLSAEVLKRDADLRALKSLLHPEMMGTQFKYLALSRGIDLATPLAGFRHSRPAAETLNTSRPATRTGTAPGPSSPDR